MARGIGIDLGTTYSLAAIVKEGSAGVFKVDGDGRMPSAVFFAEQADTTGGAMVGWHALAAARAQAGSLLTSTKRFMGRGKEAGARALAEGARTFALVDDTMAGLAREADDVRMVHFAVPDGIGGTKATTPVQVAAFVLKALKDRAEEQLGEPVKDAVITVPAYFDDAQRQATRDAGRLAGLHVLRLLAEPTAAAVAYGLDKQAEAKAKQGGIGTYVVFDLGGGTFDISVLEFDRGLFRVRATSGDTSLGGDDFDLPIARRILAAAGLNEQGAAPRQVQQALAMARHAKELLSERESVDVSGVLDVDGVARPIEFTLTRAELEAIIAPVLSRCTGPCERALRDAGLDVRSLDGVILVGGSTRVPLVRRFVRELFGQEPLLDAHPDEVVAAGAALQAELLTGGDRDMLLLDVTPLSLGLETMGGVIDKLVPRNSPIPCTATHTFTTYADKQTAMDIHIVQGEREKVDHCKSLARFKLRGIPPLGAGLARVAVTFHLDADGLLTVSAREQSSGVTQSIEVKPSYGLTDAEVETMLLSSIDHAREDIEERMLIEKRVEGRRILAATHKALDEDGALLSALERVPVDAAIRALEESIAGDDRHAMQTRTEELDAGTQELAHRRMTRRIGEALENKSVDDILHDARTGNLP